MGIEVFWLIALAVPMSDPLKGAVRAAVLRLLEPLMKLLLDAGLGVGDFIGLAKVAYFGLARSQVLRRSGLEWHLSIHLLNTFR